MTEWKVSNCPKCGGPLKSMSEDIKFCPYCGVELEKVIPEKKLTININKKVNKEVRTITRDEAEIEKVKANASEMKWLVIMEIVLVLAAVAMMYFNNH